MCFCLFITKIICSFTLLINHKTIPQMSTTATKFTVKKLKLERALAVVQVKLACFKSTSENMDKSGTFYTDGQREAILGKWNDWHDLKYRLEDRLRDNWSAFCDWHFDEFGFNAYNL